MNFDLADFNDLGKLLALLLSIVLLWYGIGSAARRVLLRRNGVRIKAKITDSRIVRGFAPSDGNRTYYTIEFVDHNGQLQRNEVGGFNNFRDVITNGEPGVDEANAKTGDIPIIFDRRDPTSVKIDDTRRLVHAPLIMILIAVIILVMLARDVHSNYY